MKQVFNITADSSNEGQDQLLCIRIGERHFGFAISTTAGDELYKLAWYTDEEVDEKVLEDLYQQHPELRQNYTNTRVCFDHPQSILVPLPYYNESESSLLLRTMYGPSGKQELHTEAVPEWQLKNVYAIPQAVQDWTRHYFSNGAQYHQYSISIRNINTTEEDGHVLADFRTDDFSLLVSRGNKILIAQTYPYTTPADVIYYLLKVCQEYGLSQETVRLQLSGLIDRQSVLFREIYQYFINVAFREPSWTTAGTEQDAEFPPHFFTSLNDLARCGS